MSERPLRVLYVVHQFFPKFISGTEQYVLALAKAGRAAGDDVRIYSVDPDQREPERPAEARRYEVDGVPVVCHEFQKSDVRNHVLADWWNPRNAASFAALLDEMKPDVAHCFHLRFAGIDRLDQLAARRIPYLVHLMDFWFVCPNFLLLRDEPVVDAAGAPTGEKRKVQCDGPPDGGYGCFDCVHTVMAPWAREPWAREVRARRRAAGEAPADDPSGEQAGFAMIERPLRLREALGRAARAFAPSRTVQDALARAGIALPRLERMPYAIDRTGLDRLDPPPADSVQLGFLGTFAPHKGVAVLLEALRGLVDPGVRLRCFGRFGDDPGYDAKLRALAAGDPRIEFAGPFARADLARVLSGLHVLVVPSLWRENTPFVCLEGRAAGLEVVTSDLEGMTECVPPTCAEPSRRRSRRCARAGCGASLPTARFPPSQRSTPICARATARLDRPGRPTMLPGMERIVLALAVLPALSACDGGGTATASATGQEAVSPAAGEGSIALPTEGIVAPVRPAGPEDFDLVFLSIDTLRADHLECYGYGRETAPRLAGLAARGVLFEEALVQWPKTAPSFCSMLTSTYATQSGMRHNLKDDRVPVAYETIAEILRGAGYQTFGVVSNLCLDARWQFDQGFEHYVCSSKDNKGAVVTDLALDAMRKRDRARRFMLWAHYIDPHAPYRPPKRLLERFRSDEHFAADERPPLKVDPAALDRSLQVEQGNELGQIPKHAHLGGKDRLRDYVAAYDADIAYCDSEIGRLLDSMEADGHLGRAAIVVVADHGEGLGEHDYFFEHGRYPYDDCVHVPLILVHPDLEPRRVASPIALLDLAPTVLDLMKQRPAWQSQGASRLDWIRRGAPEDEAVPVFTESGYSDSLTYSMRKGRWKIVRFTDRFVAEKLGAAPWQLFDVVADPGELASRVDDEPELFEELRAELDAYIEVARARVPPPSDSGAIPMSDAERAQMHALGYTEGER
jgi:arylsulfatase A-like enzyme/glycosyltransferase involved in cell wall biosynthesis